jgi:hypothetical protein
MHIVHTPVDRAFDGVDYSSATDLTGALAVYGVWFEVLDCEAIEDDEEATTACIEKRAPSDAFFAAMSVFANTQSSFTQSVTNVPIQEFVNSLSVDQFYSYNGGLTTPPCTEGVRWTMVQKPAPISPVYLANLNARYVTNTSFAPDCSSCSGGNNRLTNPVNERTIYYNNGALQAVTLSLTLSALTTLIM